MVLSFILGVVSDRLVYRPLMKAPGTTIVLATVGFSYLLKGIARYIWGGKGEYISIKAIVDPAPLFLWGIPILPQQLIVFGAAVAFMLAFAAFFRFTRAGKMMQATRRARSRPSWSAFGCSGSTHGPGAPGPPWRGRPPC